MKYVSPVAERVNLEALNVLLTSNQQPQPGACGGTDNAVLGSCCEDWG